MFHLEPTPHSLNTIKKQQQQHLTYVYLFTWSRRCTLLFVPYKTEVGIREGVDIIFWIEK